MLFLPILVQFRKTVINAARPLNYITSTLFSNPVITPTRTWLEHMVPLNNTETLKGKCIGETMRQMPLAFREQQTALPGYTRKARSSPSIKPS
jgi:hypothetical protein